MMRKLLYYCFGFAIFIVSCTTNAITGRSQLALVPESSLQKEAITQYNSFLSGSKVVTSIGNNDAEMVKRVGNRIAGSHYEIL